MFGVMRLISANTNCGVMVNQQHNKAVQRTADPHFLHAVLKDVKRPPLSIKPQFFPCLAHPQSMEKVKTPSLASAPTA